MTRYQLARMAVRAYPAHELASRRTVNKLRRAWMEAVQILGDNWVLAKANWQQRKEQA